MIDCRICNNLTRGLRLEDGPEGITTRWTLGQASVLTMVSASGWQLPRPFLAAQGVRWRLAYLAPWIPTTDDAPRPRA